MNDDPRPYYTFHVFCCTNQRPDHIPRVSCASKDSVKLREYMKERAMELGLEGVRINSAGCLNRCEQGPAMVIYPEGVWYRFETREDVDEILSKHIEKGERVPRLMMRTED